MRNIRENSGSKSMRVYFGRFVRLYKRNTRVSNTKGAGLSIVEEKKRGQSIFFIFPYKLQSVPNNSQQSVPNNLPIV